MENRKDQMTQALEKKLLKAAGATLAVCSLAGIGFFGAYAVAGSIYGTPQQQEASVASSQAEVQPDPFSSVALIAKAAYVVDISTGRTLYQLNPDTQLPLASLTKVPLTLAVTQSLAPGTIITIPQHQSPDGAPLRIAAGGQWNLQDLIDYTLAASSNEGAELLAEAADTSIASAYPQVPQTGNDSATLWRMNDLVKDLGLSNTYFLDVTGLDLSTTQSGAYGSARDMATIFAYAASTSLSTFQATTESTVTRSTLAGQALTAQNTDEALPSIPGLLMGKTGYTDLAGGNLAVVFDAAPGHRVVAIVLGSTEDGSFSDMKQLVPAA